MYLKIAEKLSSRYLTDHSVDLNEELAKIAQQEKLNAQQIERIVNRANREIIVGLQKDAGVDPHFIFDTLKTAEVMKGINKEAGARPHLPRQKKREKTAAKVRFYHTISEYAECPEMIKDASLASNVLAHVRHELKVAKSKMNQADIKIAEKATEFRKMAEHQLLAGTPREVLDSLGAEDLVNEVADKIASWGHTIKTTNQEFEIDHRHPLVKTAQAYVELVGQRGDAQDDFDKAQAQEAQILEISRSL